MGNKVHSVGFRLKNTKDWNSIWYNKQKYTRFLQEDILIKKFINDYFFLRNISISNIIIDRWNDDNIKIYFNIFSIFNFFDRFINNKKNIFFKNNYKKLKKLKWKLLFNKLYKKKKNLFKHQIKYKYKKMFNLSKVKWNLKNKSNIINNKDIKLKKIIKNFIILYKNKITWKKKLIF